MDEQTIFPGGQNSTLPQAQPPIATLPIPTPTPLEPPPEPPPKFSLPYQRIGKLGLGILVVVAILFLIVRFVLPNFIEKKNEKVELSYWGLWEGENVMRSIISDFERENPSIKVLYKKQDVKQYRERLTTQIKGGRGPDVFRFHNTWLPMLSQILLPLPSDVIDSQDFQKWFYPVAEQDLVRNGAIYGIPLHIDTLSLFINTEIFKAAGLESPTTWDDFSTFSRKLTVKDADGKIETAGVAMGTFDNITHASDIISLLFVQNGADIRRLSETSQNASEALAFYTSFAQGEAAVWDDTLDPSRLAFAKGNLAMYFGYSWDIFLLKAINPNLSFSIQPVPHLPGREMTIASYWAEGVSLKSKHQKEALLFMKFLTKKETEQKLFSQSSKTRLFGEPYARLDLAETLRDNQLVYPFVSEAKGAVSSFFASDTYDNGLNHQMNNYLGNAVRSILLNTSPQSAVETLASGVAQVLKQYGQ